MTATVALESGMHTGVGSLPFVDVELAVAMELEFHPGLPAAPQLPRRDAREFMLPQIAAGMPGVTIGDDGSLRADPKRVAPTPEGLPLDQASWASTLALLDVVGRERHSQFKLQLAGPVTLGLMLIEHGVSTLRAFGVAAATVRSRLIAVLAEARTRCPDAAAVVVLDEPSLCRAMHPGFPLTPEQTIDLLSSGLASATGAGAALNGVHSCGRVDWSLTLHAGPDLISLPAHPDVVADASGLACFLERGGWIAWGVVPTDRPIGSRYETHWQRLNDVWKVLASAGCDPVRLRTQSLLTPTCGLAMHDESQVPTVLELVRSVAERVQDQAYAARLSVGA